MHLILKFWGLMSASLLSHHFWEIKLTKKASSTIYIVDNENFHVTNRYEVYLKGQEN